MQKEKIPVSKIFTFGLVISLFFGGLNFFLSNSVVPELRLISFLNRYENARNEPFSAQERADKAKEFKKSSADMMSNVLIKKYSDSLKNENKSQRNSISDLFQKIPDSIMESEFSEKELAEYGISKNKFTSDFNRRDLFSLKSEIRINELSVKKLKKIDWKKNERYINSFLVIFLVCFGIIIGANFRKQLIFSLACIGILTYSQILTLQIALADYLVNDDNVIGLIFKFAIIMIVFLYLVFKMQTDKNTGANNVYNS
ncbi:hypothetical protein [Croceibacter atlanticus]|uniref:hypothetical protein n=1 Tax=Croceibacter atlanticus TaxID=313588 RepID=UPI002E1025D9|nr:hypothetical protein VVL01_01615 [Croceibacter atlanticus]